MTFLTPWHLMVLVFILLMMAAVGAFVWMLLRPGPESAPPPPAVRWSGGSAPAQQAEAEGTHDDAPAPLAGSSPLRGSDRPAPVAADGGISRAPSYPAPYIEDPFSMSVPTAPKTMAIPQVPEPTCRVAEEIGPAPLP